MRKLRIDVSLPERLFDFLDKVKEETGDLKPTVVRRALFMYMKRYELEKIEEASKIIQ